jgi:hypothetical protein
MATEDGLAIRKLADKSEGTRVTKYVVSDDGETVEKRLVNPDTEGDDHEPWPLAGIEIVNETPPQEAVLSTSFVSQARTEGWIEVEDEEVVHKPKGPKENPWQDTHTFVQLGAIIIKTVDGDVRYKVTHQPDKYDDVTGDPTDECGNPDTHVDWFYGMELDND